MSQPDGPAFAQDEYYDAHVHLTNYIQEGITAWQYLDVASLIDPAVDRIFEFCAESGLLALMHNDIQMPFVKREAKRFYFNQAKALLGRHPDAAIIWAPTELGRVVQPVAEHLRMIEEILSDTQFQHVYFDISWSEVAKYVVATPEATQLTAALLEKYPDRFLMGSDNVALTDKAASFAVFEQYRPLWDTLTPQASEKVRQGNFKRLFDAAAKRVRAWEKENPASG
jgi:predicted TIM-barrel fold metal-dependent hydrolase